MKQLSFDHPGFKKVAIHGGEHSKKSEFRTARPVATKSPMHVVFKSSFATGSMSFRGKNLKVVNHLVEKVSKNYEVVIHNYANVGNHIHLLVSCRNRILFQRWMKGLPQAIMFAVTGLNRFTSLMELIGRKYFFDYRPFSRIVMGRKGFNYCANYIEKNILEAEAVPRKAPWSNSS